MKFLDQLSYPQLLKIYCVLYNIGDPVPIRIAKELWLIFGRSKRFFFSLKPTDWPWGPSNLIFSRWGEGISPQGKVGEGY